MSDVTPTFRAAIEERAAAAPDKVWTWFDDVPVTFGDLAGRTTAVANQLLELGVEPGDSIALFGMNSPEWADVWLAAARIGALTVPTNVAFKGEFLHHQLHDSQTKLVLADSVFAPQVLQIADRLPELRTLVIRGEALDGSASGRLTVVSSHTLYAGSSSQWSPSDGLRADEPASIFYTSGTTGPSKGAVVTQQYLFNAVSTLARGWQLNADDVIYGAVPLFHFSGTVGVVLPSLAAGSTSVLDGMFHVQTCWERVRKHGATIFAGVGPMIVMLAGLPPTEDDADLPIRVISAPPIPPGLHEVVEQRYGCRVLNGYGMTEAFPLTFQSVDQPGTPGSAGRPTDAFEVRLVDDTDGDVPVGAVGEVVCRPRRPHALFEGYFNRPAETLTQLRNLWFHTGDLGRFDEEGNFYFVDRKKDALRRRGENISSFEVERSILAHPAVAECAAHAVASSVGEDDVKICVVLRPDTTLTAEALMDHCVATMPYFTVPRYVEFVEALPKNAVGRVQKFVLREAGLTPETWDREAAGYEVRR